MSNAELEVLKDLGITHRTVGLALKLTRQSVSRGLLLREAYLTEEKLRLVADYLNKENPALSKRFRHEASERLGQHGKHAFVVQVSRVPFFRHDAARTNDGASDDEARPPWTYAEEIWIFSSRPRELIDQRYLERMRTDYFVLSAEPKHPTKRLVYFSSPDRARTLGTYLLELFDVVELRRRLPVLVLESRSLSICPHFTILNPLTAPEAWALGQNEYQDDGWIRLSQANVQLILDNLKSAGIAGFTNKFFAETFNSDTSEGRNVPRFTLRFDTTDLERSRRQLALPPLQ